MNILNHIYLTRLERIRDDLNSYIKEHTEPIIQSNIPHSFLNSFHLEEIIEDEEDYAFANEEHYEAEGQIQPSPTFSTPIVDHQKPTPARPTPPMGPAMSMARPVEIGVPEFLRAERKISSIDKVLEKKAETFSAMLLRLIDEKGLKDSEVYKKANIDRRLFSKIRGDEDYVPSRKTAISFCLALQLELEDAKKLLETAGYALSESSRFDLIIMYLIENKEFNIHFANIVLNDYGEGTLSK